MLTYDEYNKALQTYQSAAQARDPVWQEWVANTSGLPLDLQGSIASPSTDYAAEWFKALPADQQQDYMAKLEQRRDEKSRSLKGRLGSLMSVIPAAVGGIGLAGAAGLLGGTGLGNAAGFPASGSIFGGGAAASGGIGAADAAGALGGVPPGGAAAALTNPAYTAIPGAAGVGSLGSAGSLLGSVGSWAASNPGLLSLLGGTLAAAGSGGGQDQPAQQTFAPQPGLQMGTLQQRPMDQSAGLLTSMAQPRRQNSGLGRFGATGGLFTPGTYTPQMYQWGK